MKNLFLLETSMVLKLGPLSKKVVRLIFIVSWSYENRTTKNDFQEKNPVSKNLSYRNIYDEIHDHFRPLVEFTILSL